MSTARANQREASTEREVAATVTPTTTGRELLGSGAGTILAKAITGVEDADATLSEPVAWFWDGYATMTAHVEVAGQSAGGKSTFMTAVVAAAAAPPEKPVKLFGRLVTPMPVGKVALVVFEENSRRSSVEKIDGAFQALGIDRTYGWDRVLLVARAGVRARLVLGDDLRNPAIGDTWAAIMHAAAMHRAFGLVVLDTRARIFGGCGPSSDEDAAAEAGAIVTMLSERSGCPVFVCSHLRKGGAGTDLDDISGSAQRAATADAVLMIRGNRVAGQTISSRVTLAKQRDGVDDWPAPAEFRIAKDGSGRWKMDEGEALEAAGLGAHERAVKALADAGKPLTSRQLREAAGLSGKAVADALRVLVAERRVEKRRLDVRGVEREVFALILDFEELANGGAE